MSNITTPPARSRGPATYADRTALAKQILANSAAAVAEALLPVADYYPNRGVVLNQQTVFANASLNDVNLTFPTDGYLVAIRASTEDGAAASMAGILLRVQVNGNEDLYSSGSGNGAGYISLAQLVANYGKYNLRRAFCQANSWSISFMNVTAGNLMVDLCFDIVDTRNPPE